MSEGSACDPGVHETHEPACVRMTGRCLHYIHHTFNHVFPKILLQATVYNWHKRTVLFTFLRQSRPRGSVLYYCGAVCAFTFSNYEIFYKLCCTRGMFYHIKCLHWLDRTRIIWAVSGLDVDASLLVQSMQQVQGVSLASPREILI